MLELATVHWRTQMPATLHSQRRERAELSARLRAAGKTWAEIAAVFRERYRINARVAMRLAHGWSQREVADRWTARWPDDPKTLKHISYWEQWPAPSGHEPGLRVLASLACLYQCSAGELLADVGDFRQADTAATTGPPKDTSWITEGGGRVQRREFLTASAAVAGTLAAAPQFAYLAAGRRIGADVPATLARRLSRLRRLDNYLGGSETYRLYAAELEATKTLAREAVCTQQTSQELLAIISEQAQQAGWAAFDADWQQTARTLYQESLDAARAAGSRALEGNALALLAYQNLATGAPAADLAEASCQAAGSGTPPSVRALLHERRAWAIAHETTGPDEARRALGIAAAALEERDAGHAPDWAAWVDHTELQIMTGRCLTRLGQPLAAIPVLHAALDRFDDAQARDKALYMSWLAEAYLDAGEIDTAAAVAGDVLALSAGVASARPAQRLRVIAGRLAGRSAVPAVAALLDQVSSARPTTTWPG
jgi:hypothetical protein